MANKQHNNRTVNEYKPSTMPSFLISCFLILMFSVFSLFLTNEFAHARTDKYYLYLGLSAALIVGVVIASIVDYSEQKQYETPSLRFMPLSASDISFLCFYGFAAISTLLSDYKLESFLGVFPNGGGRNNGLLLMTVYLLVYLIITRRYTFKEYVIAIYLLFSSGVAFLAIVNYFYIDILGIYTGYLDLWELFNGSAGKPNVIIDFGSTIGNKNMISAFMCMFLPIAVMTFVLCKQRWLRILAGFASGFAYCGLLCADSSSGVLGLFVIIAVMAIFAAHRCDTLKRYFLALAILLVSSKLLRLFSYIRGDLNKGFEFLQDYLIYSPSIYILIAVFALLFILMQVFEKKLEPHYPRKAITAILIVLTAGGVLTAIGAVVYYSVIDTEAALNDNLSGLLRFDENWGTHRGYYWIKSLDEYRDLSILHKLFGTGPDSVYVIMEPYFPELTARFNEGLTDCVHNEFLNYFLSQGALGLAAYLALLGSVTIRALRRSGNNPMILIFLSAVICYAVQSVVNIYQPITTPLFFIFLSLTEALNRQTPITSQKIA